MNKPFFTVDNFSFLKIYRFECERFILKETFEKIKSLDFSNKNTGNYTSNLRINNLEKFSKIHEWFQECVDLVFLDLKLPNTFKNIKIIESWANKTRKGEYHHSHSHAHSYLSGVFYLNDNHSCNTVFKSGNIWYSDDFLFEKYKGDNYDDFSEYNFFEEKTKAGNLIIFPSRLKHHVNENLHDDRFTIAFNAYPEIHDENFATYMNLKVSPYGQE